MNKVVSIVVTVSDGKKKHTFDVDLEQACCLFWNQEGWDVLADFYRDVKKDPKEEKEVRERKCPKAKPRKGTMRCEDEPGDGPVIALKDPECNPTQWP
jgi:hypothetical protein